MLLQRKVTRINKMKYKQTQKMVKPELINNQLEKHL